MSQNRYFSEHNSLLVKDPPPRSASRSSIRSDLDLDKPLPPLRRTTSEKLVRDAHHRTLLPERAATPAFSVRSSRLHNRPAKISLSNLFSRSTLETEDEPGTEVSPIMPSLSAVYSQAIKATIAHTSHADETLRPHRPSRIATSPSRNTRNDRGTDEVRRLSKYPRGNISAERKVFALIPGHLLQYAERGLNDRLPERSFRLTKNSIAVASDLVPGKPYTVQITEATTILKASASFPSTSLLTRLRLRGFNVPTKTPSILIIFSDSVELEEWLRALRREISALGGLLNSSEATDFEQQDRFDRADSLGPVPCSRASTDLSDHHGRPRSCKFNSFLHFDGEVATKGLLNDTLAKSSKQSPSMKQLLPALPGTTSDFAVPVSRFSADSGVDINARLKSSVHERDAQSRSQLRTSNSFSSIRSVRSIIPPTIREVSTPSPPKSPACASRRPMRQLHSRRASPLPIQGSGQILYRSSSYTTLQNDPVAPSVGRRHSHSTTSERPAARQASSISANSKSSAIQAATSSDSEDEHATEPSSNSSVKLSLFPSPPTSPPMTSPAVVGRSLNELASRSNRPLLKRPASHQVRPRPSPVTTDVRLVTSSDIQARVGLGIEIPLNEASATNDESHSIHARTDDTLSLPRLDLGLPVIGLAPPPPPPHVPLPEIPQKKPLTPQLTRNA